MEIAILVICATAVLMITALIFWLFKNMGVIYNLEKKIEELEGCMENTTLSLALEIQTLHENINKEHTCQCKKENQPTREVNDKSLWEPYCTNQ